MQRGFKRVRYRVAVLPTMAACPAPEASRAAKPARSAPEEAPKSRGRTSRSSTSDGFSPAKARATDKLATAPLPKGDVQRALQQEHDKAEQLARELAAAWRGLRSQATAMADNAAHDQQLSDLRQGLQHAEASAAANREMLAQERARKQDLQQQFAVRGEASPDRGSNAAASLSETPTLPPTTDKQLAVFPANDRPMLPAKNTPATVATRPAPAEAFGDPELARLISRACLLLSQGNIGTARIVLERAAETGSAPALFALAETHDPTTLAAWGTFGTQGDVARAQELYAKALAGGVLEAKDRLNALR
jgi:hypothetical protein